MNGSKLMVDIWWTAKRSVTKSHSPEVSVLSFCTLLPCFAYLTTSVLTLLIESLSRHNNWIRKNISSERVLTMELKQGWEPLAKILGKPIPDEPFPHANDGEAMQKYAKSIFRTATLVWAGILGGAGTAAWMGLATWKSW